MRSPGLKNGSYVRISNDISKTDVKFQTTEEMREMKGKVYKVSYISRDSVSIDNFTWHIDDIELISDEEKKPQPFHFDIEVLHI